MNVSTLFIQVHSPTMRHIRGLKHEETTRIKQGNNTFCMRHWLRLHVAQLIILSYSLPMSMLSPGGIDCNIYTFSIYIITSYTITNQFSPPPITLWVSMTYMKLSGSSRSSWQQYRHKYKPWLQKQQQQKGKWKDLTQDLTWRWPNL